MGTPKQNEEKISQIVSAWESLASAKTFAGMTLEEFKARVKPSADTRIEVAKKEDQLSAAITARVDADEVSLNAVALVVNAVKGDPTEGEDGALYEAMGYIRKSERKSGLRRSKKTTVTPA